jgi:hypothetical protein
MKKYALLAYDTHGSLDNLPTDDKQALHKGHRALHDEHRASAAISAARVIAHYRLRSPSLTTTLRLADGEIVRSEGPAVEASEALRALYVLESDDPGAVLDLASRLPAVRMGATVEVWPLIETDGHSRGRRSHRSWIRRQRREGAE